jgi:hypothetical protein
MPKPNDPATAINSGESESHWIDSGVVKFNGQFRAAGLRQRERL